MDSGGGTNVGHRSQVPSFGRSCLCRSGPEVLDDLERAWKTHGSVLENLILVPTPSLHLAPPPQEVSLDLIPTCFEDLVPDGEARPVGLVVGHELDEQLSASGDDRGGRDLPAELAQHGGALVPAVVHLHVVVPVGGARRLEGSPQVLLQMGRAFGPARHRLH